MPFVIQQRDDRVIVQIYLTARNPLVELADGVRRFLLIVAGDDAYVPTTGTLGDNVSTWLYEAVHLAGVAHLCERDENRAHGDALLDVSEARLPKAALGPRKMEPTKRETMLASIRVIDLIVDEIEGQASSTSTRAMRTMWRSRTVGPRGGDGQPAAGREDAGAAAGAGV